jgi:hypothetical protein
MFKQHKIMPNMVHEMHLDINLKKIMKKRIPIESPTRQKMKTLQARFD